MPSPASSAAETSSWVDSGLQPVMAISAPASASTSASTAVLASTCIAIATTSPSRGFVAANSAPTAVMIGMCSRAHAIFRRPDSRAGSGSASRSLIDGWVMSPTRDDAGKTLPLSGPASA